MTSIRPPPTLLSMKVAIRRFAARCEPRGEEIEDTLTAPGPSDPPDRARLEAEIVARDGYIRNLAARNLLLRMEVRELKSEVKRLRQRRRPVTS